MAEKVSLKKSVAIQAPVAAVWKALTDPELIRNYFFGVNAEGKWKEGNTIIYKGEWQGKKYEGKGKVLKVEDEKLLRHSYWSDISSIPDEPGNYHIITYKLAGKNGDTQLELTEENLDGQPMKEQSSKLWDTVFENLKKLLET